MKIKRFLMGAIATAMLVGGPVAALADSDPHHDDDGGDGTGEETDFCDNKSDGEYLVNLQIVVCIGGDVVSIG